MDVRAPAVTAEETLSDIDVAIVSIPLKALPHITHLIPGCDGHIAEIDAGPAEGEWVSEQLERPIVKARNVTPDRPLRAA
jgi:hypothetical protein